MERGDYLTRIREIRERFGFDFVSIATVLEAQHPLLTWVYATGNLNTRYRRIVLEPGKGIAGGVYKAQRPMVIQDARKELSPSQRVEHPITISENLVSAMAVPLWRGEEVEGILLMAFRKSIPITEDLFDRVMAALVPLVCDFTVRPATFGASLHSGERNAETVPVYELMNYHIIRAQEEERRRISRDLHDSVIQAVVGVQLLLRSMKYQSDEDSRSRLVEEADQRLSRIQDELRTISSGLRPMTLDDLGLVAAMYSYLKRTEESRGIRIRFDQQVGRARYATEVETVFYRVCQEAVLNACKYSGSAELKVSLTESEGYLTLEVTDYGVGFDPERLEIKGTGMGIPGMSDRAELIDGELTYQTAPGKGVSIWLTAPIERRESM